MKYCPYCGAVVLDDAAFCMSCGKPIPVVSAQATPAVQEAYDGYYDDVPTDDPQTNSSREHTDPGAVKISFSSVRYSSCHWRLYFVHGCAIEKVRLPSVACPLAVWRRRLPLSVRSMATHPKEHGKCI